MRRFRTARGALGYARGALSLLQPPPPEGELALPSQEGRRIALGHRFRMLCWNIQYCGGRGRRFFYDGGADVRVDRVEVEEALAGVGALIRAWSPDLVLLQEVDRSADRTVRIDQHEALARAVGLPLALSAPYHRVNWVPFPFDAQLGRVDMHLSVLSAFQATRAARWNLPLLRETWLRRRFNLRRILLEVDLATESGAPLRVFNTHLSAFSYGDGSLGQQIARCVSAGDAAERNQGRWAMAGDFNTLPPGDRPSRLGADAALYPEAESPIRALTDRFATAETPETLGDHRWRSWIPWGSNQPDRQLDWMFRGSGIQVLEHRVDPAGGRWSDHLPLITDLLVTPG